MQHPWFKDILEASWDYPTKGVGSIHKVEDDETGFKKVESEMLL